MKVVFCKSQLLGPISGADEILVNNAILLREAGHAVEVLLMYYTSADDPYYRRLVEAGVPVTWLASSATRASLFTGRRLFHKVLRLAPPARGRGRRSDLRLRRARREAQRPDGLDGSLRRGVARVPAHTSQARGRRLAAARDARARRVARRRGSLRVRRRLLAPRREGGLHAER